MADYEVRVEAEQAERPSQVFVAAVSEAIQISEEKYCSVKAMLKHSAVVRTTFEVINNTVASATQIAELSAS